MTLEDVIAAIVGLSTVIFGVVIAIFVWDHVLPLAF